MIGIISGKRNLLKVYDPNFDESKTYQFSFYSLYSCRTYTVDCVFTFCEDYVTFDFELPCIPAGHYEMTIINITDQEQYKKRKIWISL